MTQVNGTHVRKGKELSEFATKLDRMSIVSVLMEDGKLKRLHVQHDGQDRIQAEISATTYSQDLEIREILRPRYAVGHWKFSHKGWNGNGIETSKPGGADAYDPSLIQEVKIEVAFEMKRRIEALLSTMPEPFRENTLDQIRHIKLVEVEVRLQNGLSLPVNVRDDGKFTMSYIEALETIELHESGNVERKSKPANDEMSF